MRKVSGSGTSGASASIAPPPPGRGDIAAGDEHPRPFDLAGIDCVAQCDIGQPAIDADVADGREPRAKLGPRCRRALEDGRRLAVLKRLGRVTAIGLDRAIGEVCMEVDEPREHGVARPVDRCRPVSGTPRRDRRDLAGDDADTLIGQDRGRRRIDQPSGAHVDRLRAGRSDRKQRRRQREQVDLYVFMLSTP